MPFEYLVLFTVNRVNIHQIISWWGERLTIADQSAIRTCINDFVVRALLPFNERRMKALNEVSYTYMLNEVKLSRT